jgi:hypothetical protein
MGFASSAISNEAVRGVVEGEMRERYRPVCEEFECWDASWDMRPPLEALGLAGDGDRRWCDVGLPFEGVAATAGFWTGLGFGRGPEDGTSSSGIEKQKQQESSFLSFLFARTGFGGVDGPFSSPGGRVFCPGFGRWVFSVRFRSASQMPKRSARVSRLVLSSSIGVFESLGPGLDCADSRAWSLCCQQ